MQLHPRHAWTVTPREAVSLQHDLRGEIDTARTLPLAEVRLVAGVDVSVKNGMSRAAVVVTRLPDFAIVETVLATRPTPFPYVPGLLSFREGPVLEEAFSRLASAPDVFIFDGMGIAHPRRIGIASHMGLWLEKPTIGCGKTLLVGQFGPLGPEKGATAPLVDKGETIGVALRTRERVSPVFISPGHRIDLASAVAVTLAATTRFRLPEPIRFAHAAAGTL
ncbi:deoxyribonuclease V [Chelatococcus composti]|jgi:deoxyribonuclease V|uniref:Endonuclease V n=1 Tax=Chelatococcus composti TaxID=1743235 RepID=A0A841KF06_9HYPH|nr:deoxyribonuclease V [Chelatococcus composti]MBB6168003.1 deoxyribonuclease V [Chelatococcus composti]MBS7734805.1 deoxyribonuclease V [Chelatococcus composti]PZN44388.1 MAG: endonuclease V [Pseudomonadota bacterium]GGG34263.1 endonuclease V [Chelatococcus composti]